MIRGIALALVLLASVSSRVADAQSTVILLSLDGVRHDYPERDAEALPALSRIAREGLRAEGLIPVFPSSTFPSHVSLVTGTYPDRHGIVGNRFLDPERGEFDYSSDASWIEAEPLWVAAERQGVRTATFFWVGSGTDWNGVGPSFRRAPFDDDLPESAKVDQLLAWLDLPAAERPRLLLSWWHGADAAGHRYGPDAPETRRQLAAQDAQLSRLLAGLDTRRAWATTTLLVVSDHGMAELSERIDARAPLRRRGIEARVVHGGAYAHVHLADPARLEEARAALDALPGVRSYTRASLPPPLRYAHPRRTGDLVALTDPPRAFSSSGLSRLFDRSRGGHGYDAERFREMDGVFLALGRGVPRGRRLGRVRAVEVAPTVAKLLGIEPPRHCEAGSLEFRRILVTPD